MDKFLEKTFEATKVANHLLLFNIQAAKWFIGADKMKQIDACFGFIDDQVNEKFKDVIINIKKVSTYKEFINLINFNDTIKSPQEMISFITNAKNTAKKSKYLNF